MEISGNKSVENVAVAGGDRLASNVFGRFYSTNRESELD